MVLIGDSGVGKSNLISRYVHNTVDLQSKSTAGLEFSTRCVEMDGKRVRVKLWDFARTERYSAISRAFYRGAIGALIVYDVTDRKTFEGLERWFKQLREHMHTTTNKNIFMLVGNKCDLVHNRQVTTEEGKACAAQHGVAFIETSALRTTNIEKSFMKLLTDVYRKNTVGAGDDNKDRAVANNVEESSMKLVPEIPRNSTVREGNFDKTPRWRDYDYSFKGEL